MLELETCNTDHICIGHVHKGNRALKYVISELCPLEWHTYFGPYHTVLLLLCPYLLLQYLILHRKSDMHWTCAKGKQNFDPEHYCRIMSPWMTYIFWPYRIVVLFVSPQLPLKYLMQGFETCYTVQTCIWYVHKRNRIAELCPLKRQTCSPFVIALATSFINRF